MNPFAKRALTESEVAQFDHTSYVLNRRSVACTSCGAIHDYADVSEVWTHPHKTTLTNARILRPTGLVKPGFDVHVVEHQESFTPLCHECIPASGTVHSMSRHGTLSHSAWADTLARKAFEDRAATLAAKATTARHVPTLEDL